MSRAEAAQRKSKRTGRVRRVLIVVGACVLALAAFMFTNNTSLFVSRPPGEPVLLAHRGLALNFDRTDLQNDTCTAERMLPTDHDYLENTIPSMKAAFELGADVVEIDVHPTTDGQFAVFHDWTLDCRTDGHGDARDHAMTELKTLAGDRASGRPVRTRMLRARRNEELGGIV